MSRAFVELVAAVGPRWELGHKGGMPWPRIKGDLALFRKLTEGKAVIMGRKTWESLPPAHRPLKGRRNIILTRDDVWGRDVDLPSVHVMSGGGGYSALEWAISRARGAGKQPVIIGGGEVYRAALEADLVDVVHLSVIAHPSGWEHDVTFPALNPRGWTLTNNGSWPPARTRHEPEEGAPHGWSHVQLVRNPLEPALRPDSDGVSSFWGGAGWWC